ncbi:MAG: hypothetical protein PF508_21200 [Spirochaeta sp.]|jgi:hypothetical protein|nr:hypothetical protein [Spirochaeta sp.]
MKTNTHGTFRRHILTLTAIFLAVTTLTGCFWTPEDAKEGGITVNINTGALGASALEDFDGFFLGYVIADDLLRGDQAAADQAFAEVEVALEEAFTFDDGTLDENDFRVEVSFPSIQLQANLFTGTSGSNSFRGLRAGTEYLVVVMASSWASTADAVGGVGYAVTTVAAGESKSVDLDVSEANWAKLDTFLLNRYGIQPEPEPILEPATITLDVPTGTSYYYDLVSADSVSLPLSGSYESWYSTVTVLNNTGSTIGKSGNRQAVESNSFTIEGIAPDKSWRLMVVTWPEREYGGIGGSNAEVYLSPAFQLGAGQSKTLQFSGTVFSYTGDFSAQFIYAQNPYGSSPTSAYARPGYSSGYYGFTIGGA